MSFAVIRRNFLFDAYYILNIPCGGGNSEASFFLAPPVATFDYFHFDDDLSFHPGPNVFIGPPDTPAVKSCPDHGCHDALVTGAPGNLELNDLSGEFHGAQGFFLLGENFQKSALPPYTEQGNPVFCTGSDGANLFISAILSPYDGIYWRLLDRTQTSKSDEGPIVLNWEWRSIDGDIPPEGK